MAELDEFDRSPTRMRREALIEAGVNPHEVRQTLSTWEHEREEMEAQYLEEKRKAIRDVQILGNIRTPPVKRKDEIHQPIYEEDTQQGAVGGEKLFPTLTPKPQRWWIDMEHNKGQTNGTAEQIGEGAKSKIQSGNNMALDGDNNPKINKAENPMVGKPQVPIPSKSEDNRYIPNPECLTARERAEEV